MDKYRVTFNTLAHVSASTVVEANSPEEADQKAKSFPLGDLIWEYEGIQENSQPYIQLEKLE